MPISTANFSTSQSLGNNSNITFTDLSIGSDAGLTIRKIYVRLANGKYLTAGGVENVAETAIDWAIANSSITINLLTQSTTANVRVDWLTNSTVTYTKTLDTPQVWNLYDYLFGLELIQSQTATPEIIQDQSYYSSFFQFITNIWNAEVASTYGSDIFSSQSSLNRNQKLINKSDFYF